MKKLKTLLLGLLVLSLLLCGCAGGTKDGERPLSLGRMKDGVYVNDYLDLSFHAEDWAIVLAEDNPQTPPKILNAQDGRKMEEAVAGMPIVIAMMAVAPDGKTNVNLVYSRMDEETGALTQEQIVDVMLADRERLAKGFEAPDVEVLSVGDCTETFLGQQRRMVEVQVNMEGSDDYMLQFIEKPYDRFAAVITIYATDRDEALSILEMFERPSLQTSN